MKPGQIRIRQEFKAQTERVWVYRPRQAVQLVRWVRVTSLSRRPRNQKFAAETTENIGFTRRSLRAGCSPGNRSTVARHLHARLRPSPVPAARDLNNAAPPARIFPAHFRPQPVPAKPPATCRAEVWTLPSRSRFSEEKPSSPQAVRPAAPPAQRSTPS